MDTNVRELKRVQYVVALRSNFIIFLMTCLPFIVVQFISSFKECGIWLPVMMRCIVSVVELFNGASILRLNGNNMNNLYIRKAIATGKIIIMLCIFTSLLSMFFLTKNECRNNTLNWWTLAAVVILDIVILFIQILVTNIVSNIDPNQLEPFNFRILFRNNNYDQNEEIDVNNPETVINNLNIIKYNKLKECINKNSDKQKDSDSTSICCVCLDNFGNDDVLRHLKCEHYFHKDCLDTWLKVKLECPLCKKIPQKSSLDMSLMV